MAQINHIVAYNQVERFIPQIEMLGLALVNGDIRKACESPSALVRQLEIVFEPDEAESGLSQLPEVISSIGTSDIQDC
jgi:hypothetical protein